MSAPSNPRRLALLIGNAGYADERLARLAVPEPDVRALGAVLKDPAICGFDEVRTLLDAPKAAIEEAIEDLFTDRGRDDLLLLYFSGHGLLDDDQDLYLAMTGTRTRRPLSSALAADWVRKVMNKSRSRRQVLVLDCCYSGRFARSVSKGPGSAIGQPVAGTAALDVRGYGRVVLLSSKATELSWQGDTIIGDTDRSLFTHFLVEGLRTGAAAPDNTEIAIGGLYDYVYRQMLDRQARQTPQLVLDGPRTGELIIARNPNPPAAPAPIPEALRAALADEAYWTRLGAVTEIRHRLARASPAEREALLGALRSRRADERDHYVVVAIDELLADAATAVPDSVASADTAVGKASGDGPLADADAITTEEPLPAPFSVIRDKLQDGTEGPEMIMLPAGRFRMGSPDDEPERFDDERLHEVEVAAFAIGRTAVTFAQYDRFAKATDRELPDDAGWGRDDRPVINVSWHDAVAYADWISDQTGKPYRLPTEAEWEYAARAGTETPFWTGDGVHTDQVNYDGNDDYGDRGAKTGVYREQTVPVGSLPANPWGLHEVLGNVWEWTGSAYDQRYSGAELALVSKDRADSIALRGGSWYYKPRFVRAAFRLGNLPDFRFFNVGFRLARTLTP